MGMNLLERGLWHEAFETWLGVLSILFLVVAGQRFVDYLGNAALGTLDPNLVLVMVSLASIKLLPVILPAALFFALMLHLGRLQRDHELLALRAAGLSPLRLYRPYLALALPIALLTGYITLDLSPWAHGYAQELKDRQQRRVDLLGLNARQFHEFNQGRLMVYVDAISADGLQLHNIVLQQREGERQWLVTAQRGRQDYNPDTGERLVVLEQGYRYSGKPGNADFEQTLFQRYVVRLEEQIAQIQTLRRGAIPTRQLWNSNLPMEQAELHYRLSLPIVVLVLALLALPLGKAPPRSGKYGRLLLALLVFSLYLNLLGVGVSLLDRSALPAGLGLWWLHLGFVALAWGLLWRDRGAGGWIGRR